MNRTQLLTVGYCVCLAAVIAVVYTTAIDGPFIYDDVGTVSGNPHIRQLWPLSEAMSAPKDNPIAGRPLVALSLAVNYAIGAFSPRGYHVFNILLHIVNCFVLLGVVRRALTLTSFKDAALPLSMAVTLLWALHPLQTETVQYVTQRTELMVVLFYLLTIYCFLRATAATAKRAIIWQLAAVTACTFGMVTKEVMVSAPLFMLLFDRQFVSRTFANALRRRPWFYVGLAGTWGVLLLVLLAAPRSRSVGFHLGISALEYLYTQAQVIWWYIRLCFWPSPLVVHYEWPVVRQWTQAALPGLGILVLLAATAVGLCKRHPASILGVLFFFVLAPSSSFVPIVTEIVAERRMYLPLAAVVTGVVLTGWWLVRKLPAAGPAGAVVLLVLASAMVWGSHDRLKDYRSEWAVWASVLEVYPESPAALNMLAQEYIDRGEMDKAMDYARKSVKYGPKKATSLLTLSGLLIVEGEYDEAEALLWPIVETGEKVGKVADAYANLGVIRSRQQRWAEAITFFTRAIEIAPELAKPYHNVGVLYRRMGQPADAVYYFEKAIELSLDKAHTRKQLADLYEQLQRYDEAETQLKQLVAEEPESATNQDLLGAFYARRGRFDLAVPAFERAVALQQSNASLQLRLAESLRALGRFDEAAAIFEQLTEAIPDDARAYFRLARVRLDQGQVDQAVTLLKQAVSIDPEHAQAVALLGELMQRSATQPAATQPTMTQPVTEQNG